MHAISELRGSDSHAPLSDSERNSENVRDFSHMMSCSQVANIKNQRSSAQGKDEAGFLGRQAYLKHCVLVLFNILHVNWDVFFLHTLIHSL